MENLLTLDDFFNNDESFHSDKDALAEPEQPGSASATDHPDEIPAPQYSPSIPTTNFPMHSSARGLPLLRSSAAENEAGFPWHSSAAHKAAGKAVLAASPPPHEVPLDQMPNTIECGLSDASSVLGQEGTSVLFPAFGQRRGRPDWASLSQLSLESALSSEPAVAHEVPEETQRKAPWNSQGRRLLRRLLPSLALCRVSKAEFARATPAWRLHLVRLLQLASENACRDAIALAAALQHQGGEFRTASQATAAAQAAQRRADTLAAALRGEVTQHRESLARLHRMLQAAVTASGGSAGAVQGAVQAYITAAYRRLAAQESKLADGIMGPISAAEAVREEGLGSRAGAHVVGGSVDASAPGPTSSAASNAAGGQGEGRGGGGLRLGVDWSHGVAHASVPTHACPHCPKSFASLLLLDAHAKRRHAGEELPSVRHARTQQQHEAESAELIAIARQHAPTGDAAEAIAAGADGPMVVELRRSISQLQEQVTSLTKSLSTATEALARRQAAHSPAEDAVSTPSSGADMGAMLEHVRRTARLEAELQQSKAALKASDRHNAELQREITEMRKSMFAAVVTAQSDLKERLGTLLHAQDERSSSMQRTIQHLRREVALADAKVATAGAATATAKAEAVEASVTRDAAAGAARAAAAAARKQLALASKMARAYILGSLLHRWYQGQLGRGWQSWAAHTARSKSAEASALVSQHQRTAAQLQQALTAARVQRERAAAAAAHMVRLRRQRLQEALLPFVSWQDPSAVDALVSHYQAVLASRAAEASAAQAAVTQVPAGHGALDQSLVLALPDPEDTPFSVSIPRALLVRRLDAEVASAAAAADRRALAVASRWWRRAHSQAAMQGATAADLDSTGAWEPTHAELLAGARTYLQSTLDAADPRLFPAASVLSDDAEVLAECRGDGRAPTWAGVDGHATRLHRVLAPSRPWITARHKHAPADVRAAIARVDALVQAATDRATTAARLHIVQKCTEQPVTQRSASELPDPFVHQVWWHESGELDGDGHMSLADTAALSIPGVSEKLMQRACAETLAGGVTGSALGEPATSIIPLVAHASNVITARHCPLGAGVPGESRFREDEHLEAVRAAVRETTPDASIWRHANGGICSDIATAHQQAAVRLAARQANAPVHVAGAGPGVTVRAEFHKSQAIHSAHAGLGQGRHMQPQAQDTVVALRSPGQSSWQTPSPIAHGTPQRSIVSPLRGGHIHFEGPVSPSPYRTRDAPPAAAQQVVGGSDASTASDSAPPANLSVSVFSEADNLPVGSSRNSPAFPLQRPPAAPRSSPPASAEMSEVEEGLLSPASGSPGTHHSSSSSAHSDAQQAQGARDSTTTRSGSPTQVSALPAEADFSWVSVQSAEAVTAHTPAQAPSSREALQVEPVGTPDSSSSVAGGDMREEDVLSHVSLHSSPGHGAAPAPPSPASRPQQGTAGLGGGFVLGAPASQSKEAQAAAPAVRQPFGGQQTQSNNWSAPTAQGFGFEFGATVHAAAGPSTLADVLAEEGEPKPRRGGSPREAAGAYQVAAMKPWLRSSVAAVSGETTPPSLPRSSPGAPDSAGLVPLLTDGGAASALASERQAAADLGFEDALQDSDMGTDSGSDGGSDADASYRDMGDFDELI